MTTEEIKKALEEHKQVIEQGNKQEIKEEPYSQKLADRTNTIFTILYCFIAVGIIVGLVILGKNIALSYWPSVVFGSIGVAVGLALVQCMWYSIFNILKEIKNKLK